MSPSIVIVGGGPAGMAAAIELAEHGRRSVLLEEAPRLGGAVYRGPFRNGVDLGFLGNRYRASLEKLHGSFEAIAASVDVRVNSRVVGATGTHQLLVLNEHERLQEIEYEDLVLATGCHERSVPFPGWTLPGVMMLGGLQLQIKSGVARPLSPTVIAGTGPLLPLVACQLHAAGVRVAGVYEACPFGKMARESLALLSRPQLFLEGLNLLTYMRRHRIAMHYGWGILEAHGEGQLSHVSVAPYDGTWRADPRRKVSLAAQTLAVGYGFLPRTQLSQQMSLEHRFSTDGHLRGQCDARQQSSSPHVYLVGDLSGLQGGEAALITGRIAAVSILQQRGWIADRVAETLHRQYALQLKPIRRFRAGVDRYTHRGLGQLELAKPDTLVCRCEHVTRSQIDKALEQGVEDIASLKMRTRVGMGDCQGRMCIGYCSDRLHASTGKGEVGWLRPRFPIEPIPLSAFLDGDAGRES